MTPHTVTWVRGDIASEFGDAAVGRDYRRRWPGVRSRGEWITPLIVDDFDGQLSSYPIAVYEQRRELDLWLLVTALGLLPACRLAWTVLQRRRGRSRALCPSFGTNLRATPERCPESGHVPAPNA